MRDEIIVEYKGDHVHARVYGKNNYEVSRDVWGRVMATCKEHNCFKILGENFTTNELSTMDAFNHLTILKEVGLTRDYRVAWVNHVKETSRGLEFVETVVVANRGLANGKLFSDVEDAKRWLFGDEKK